MAADPSEPGDAALLRAVQQRDQRALALLLARHAGWARRFAERVTGQRELAEEVVQNAFLRVWDKAEHWEGKAAFTTWFYRVLHNLCIDELRRRRLGFELLDDSCVDPAPNAEELASSEQQSRRVRAALARLPERQRTALVLSHYEERSQAEAATIMGISESALESLLVRARSALRAQLGPQAAQGDGT